MTHIVQYTSSDQRIVPSILEHGILYSLEERGSWVISMNRVRNSLVKKWVAITRNLVFAILEDTNWQVIHWKWIDTYSNNCTLIFVPDTRLFAKRIQEALENWEIRWI